VYDFLRNDSYFFQDKSMLARPLIPGLQDDLMSGPINGIAMSADFSQVYYSPLTAHELYAVSTRVLHNRQSEFAHSLIVLGNKTGGSGGMVCGERSLFYAGFEQRAVLRSDVMKNGSVAMATESILVRDNTSVMWVDTFAFNGTDLWFVANKLNLFAKKQMNFYGNESNIYIWKVDVAENGYLYRAMERTRNMNIPGVVG
jgi:sugar lactone lactonase YvrE